jgi:hypothetical protein
VGSEPSVGNIDRGAAKNSEIDQPRSDAKIHPVVVASTGA